MSLDVSASKIEHIVLSGGNIYGFTFYGILKTLHQKGIWDLSNIKTIYATSVGSIISTMIALNYDWETIDRYLINRPLGELINFDLTTMFGCIKNCGFFTIKLLEEYFYNLFTGKDLSPTITMREFYKITGVELHFFTTKVIGFEIVDLSYKTHPDWTMVEAIYASSAIFPFLSPLFKENQLYIDGGFLLNNPLNKCLLKCHEDSVFNADSILLICLKERIVQYQTKYFTIDNYNIFTFFEEFIENILKKMSIENEYENLNTNEIKLKYRFEIDSTYMNGMDFTIYTKKESRKKLIEYGIKLVNESTDSLMLM
jgi:hypothetical protein